MQERTITVGISDDHPRLRRSMINLLALLNCCVILEAGTGKELIEKMNAEELPDICLVDINMPGMDGYQTTTVIKNNWPSIKVLVYSMNDQQRSMDKAFKAGADGYLVKPSTIDDIEKAIHRLIR